MHRPTPAAALATLVAALCATTVAAAAAPLRGGTAGQQTALADPGLYRRDPAEFERLTKSLGAAEAKLAQAEDRCLELELLRETLSGG